MQWSFRTPGPRGVLFYLASGHQCTPVYAGVRGSSLPHPPTRPHYGKESWKLNGWNIIKNRSPGGIHLVHSRECNRFRCDTIPRSVFQTVQVETLLKCSRCSETLKVFPVVEGFDNYLIISTISSGAYVMLSRKMSCWVDVANYSISFVLTHLKNCNYIPRLRPVLAIQTNDFPATSEGQISLPHLKSFASFLTGSKHLCHFVITTQCSMECKCRNLNSK